LFGYFLAHPAKGELLPSLGIRRLLSIVCRPLTFHILIFSSETLAMRFQGRRFLKIGQSETRFACGGHVC
jgi:hypothetical protein